MKIFNPNIGARKGVFLPRWFCLNNNSETLKAFAALRNFSLGSFKPNLVSLTHPSLPPNIGQNSDGSISDFRISGQIPYTHNSRTKNDIDMKLGPVTKFENRNNVKKIY